MLVGRADLVVEPARTLQRARLDREAAGHAEVGDPGLACVQARKQVLGPAVQRQDRRSGQPRREPLWQRKAQIGAALIHAGQARALKMRGEAPSDRFNFGKFGHGAEIGQSRRKGHRAAGTDK